MEKLEGSSFMIYLSKDGNIKLEVKIEKETVWLNQKQIAILFGKAKSTINEHIKNIYKEGELEESLSLRKIGNSEFMSKSTNFYNLDMIISLGYRVKSSQGIHFRKWATHKLENNGKISHEYAVKKAREEYKKYRQNQDRKYISDFDKEIKKLKKI